MWSFRGVYIYIWVGISTVYLIMIFWKVNLGFCIMYGPILSSWSTSQLVKSLCSPKLIDFEFLNSFLLQRTVLGNIFIYSCNKKWKSQLFRYYNFIINLNNSSKVLIVVVLFHCYLYHQDVCVMKIEKQNIKFNKLNDKFSILMDWSTSFQFNSLTHYSHRVMFFYVI